jgi:glycosyltransferase involved in cell wall biosynthesis
VYNAVEVPSLIFQPERGQYLAFLGRISPDKGLDSAIAIARSVGMPLKIAARKPLHGVESAEVRADWDYYRTVIKPLLIEPSIDFIGEVNDHEKSEFLGKAAGLLFPIDWPEPFGLVMAEALACGTPVVARRRGSVPEIIKHGITGWIGETDDDLAEACRRLNAIDRFACRAAAEERFHPSVMATDYELAYQRLITDRAPSTPAQAHALTI